MNQILKRLKSLFTQPEPCAARLYAAIVAQARRPAFYRDMGVPDTVMGRFAMVALHVILAVERLRAQGPQGEDTAAEELWRDLQEVFFSDMDANMREMGVSDLGVPKRMRKLGELYFGQARAYLDALAADDAQALRAALARNIFHDPDAPGAEALAAYVQRLRACLRAHAPDMLRAGEIDWPHPYEA